MQSRAASFEKSDRLDKERNILYERHPWLLSDIDPYYNVNLAEDFLEYRVNVIPDFEKRDYESKQDWKAAKFAARKDKAILHFAGRYKPWEFELHKGFNDAYYYYLQKTKFANVKMPQPGRNMKGKSITRQMVRLRIADFWQCLLG